VKASGVLHFPKCFAAWKGGPSFVDREIGYKKFSAIMTEFGKLCMLVSPCLYVIARELGNGFDTGKFTEMCQHQFLLNGMRKDPA
jgi:hypothetical protein